MKIIVAAIVSILVLTGLCDLAYAESSYQMEGSGAAVMDTNNPQMYQSIFRMTLSNQSTITKGTFLVYGSDVYLHAYMLPQSWSFLYNADGSFHGQGPVQTTQGQFFDVALDGNRVFATNTGSLWKVSADMKNNNTNMILDYLTTGIDPLPTVNVSSNATVMIPNGNSNVTGVGFYIPLNLEAMRGTTVTWQNEDNIGHVIQSQDGHGNIIPIFSSAILKTGDTFHYKFDKPGVYYYFCTIHPWRTGVVTIS